MRRPWLAVETVLEKVIEISISDTVIDDIRRDMSVDAVACEPLQYSLVTFAWYLVNKISPVWRERDARIAWHSDSAGIG
jgi:hypothetical protein